ncbi:MAG: hypothetical protein H5T86_06810, partial [Armatimonadetes bacterium]|nr:hypothetical protein [Armatimonadota bacterium]
MTAVAAVIACLAVAPAQPLRLSEGGLVLGVGRQQSQAEDFLHVQDVAAGGDFVSVPCRFHGREFSGEALSLSVSGRVTQSTADIGSVWRRESFPVSILSCTIKAEPPQDRAVVVRVSLPLNAIGWQWWDDISQSRVIEDGKQYEWVCQWPSGQRISWYPLCVLTGPDGGLCAAVPLHKPRVFRFLYDGALRRLNIFFDIGLSPEARKLPCRADFDVLVFHCHREWGFRDAVERYYAIFPEYALRRAGEGGIWLLGFNPGPMSCPWDFGFRFDEGAQYRAGYDCAHGILPFVYTEPWGKYEHFGDRPTPDRKPRYGEQAPVKSR